MKLTLYHAFYDDKTFSNLASILNGVAKREGNTGTRQNKGVFFLLSLEQAKGYVPEKQLMNGGMVEMFGGTIISLESDTDIEELDFDYELGADCFISLLDDHPYVLDGINFDRDRFERITNADLLSVFKEKDKVGISLKCKSTKYLYTVSLPDISELGNGTAKAGILQEVGNWVRKNNPDVFYDYLSNVLEGGGAIKYIGDQVLFPKEVIFGGKIIKLPRLNVA